MLPRALGGEVWIAAALFVAGGAVWGPYSTIEATAPQLWSDPSHHGRIFGIQRALLSTATPVGAAAGAIALDHFPPGAILAASSAACTAAGALALCLPRLRPPTRPDSIRPTRRRSRTDAGGVALAAAGRGCPPPRR